MAPQTKLAILGIAISSSNEVVVGQQGLVMTRAGDGDWQVVESGLSEQLLNIDINENGLAVAVGGFGFVAGIGEFHHDVED